MKGENLAAWMRGGGLFISVLLVGLSSFQCPSSNVGQLGPGDGSGYGSLMGLLGQHEGEAPSRTREKTPLEKSMEIPSRGQTFILSLNALAGKKDSDSGVSGLKQGTSNKLDPTIEANIRTWQPGGIYISAANLKVLAKEVGAPSARGSHSSLVGPLRELIGLLKSASQIEPLIVTQEGGQFQRLLTAEINKSGDWEESDLGKQLGLSVLDVAAGTSPSPVGNTSLPPAKRAPDDTPYTWGIATNYSEGKHVNKIKRWIMQVYDLGFSLNYWLVGGTLRGPSDTSLNNSLGRAQTSANVLGYQSFGGQGLFPKVLKDWRKGKTVTLIGDFPGKSFTVIVDESPVWSLATVSRDYHGNEMDWGRNSGKEPWDYFKDEAEAAVTGRDIDHDRDKDENRGRDRLYYYAEAIKEKVDIVALSQDPLYGLMRHPWKSRELIDVLRNVMRFGDGGVVMVGDRTALIRDKHPEWIKDKAEDMNGQTVHDVYAGIGREMSTVVQLNAAEIKESLRAGVDLFHLWRIKSQKVKQGNGSQDVTLETESALETIKIILSDATLEAPLKKARERVLKMKKKRGYDGTT